MKSTRQILSLLFAALFIMSCINKSSNRSNGSLDSLIGKAVFLPSKEPWHTDSAHSEMRKIQYEEKVMLDPIRNGFDSIQFSSE